MEGIILKLVKKNTICGSLLIFYNIALTFGYDLPMDAEEQWNKLSELNLGPVDGTTPPEWNQTLDLVMLKRNDMHFAYIEEPNNCRFLYLLPQDDPVKMLIITVIPAFSNITINWVVTCKSEKDTGARVLDEPIQYDSALYEYTGREINSFNTTELGNGGLYLVDFCLMVNQITTVYIYVSHEYPKILALADHSERPRRIKVKKQFKTNSTLITWPELIPDEEMKIFIYWNTEKFYYSQYEALLNGIPEKEMRGSHAISVSMRNLVYGERYYVNIFLVHTIQQLSVSYARTSFIFRKFKPAKLKDGEPMVGNLTSNNGKLSFVYKVRNSASPGCENKLLFSVMPCGSNVTAEIKHKKKYLMRKRNISEYTKFEIDDPIVAGRYVIRITDESHDELLGPQTVQVFATMRPELFVLPDPISNLAVVLEEDKQKNKKGCSAENLPVRVIWEPIKSNESLQYCIHVSNLSIVKNDLLESVSNVPQTQCERLDLLFRLMSLKSQYTCQKHPPTWTEDGRRKKKCLLRRSLKLRSGFDYIVVVTAKEPNLNRYISFNVSTIHVAQNISCSSTNNFSSFQSFPVR